MANRTFQFYGSGYGSTPANITVAFAGQVIFNGSIPTVNSSTRSAADETFLFQGGEVAVDFTGSVPMQISVNSGTVVFGEIRSNYALARNPVFTDEQFEFLTTEGTPIQQQVDIWVPLANPPFTAEEITFISTEQPDYDDVKAVLQAHGVLPYIVNGPDVFTTGFYPGDYRTNVMIDGQPKSAPEPRDPDQTGPWHWTVNQGCYFSYDLNIVAGQE